MFTGDLNNVLRPTFLSVSSTILRFFQALITAFPFLLPFQRVHLFSISYKRSKISATCLPKLPTDPATYFHCYPSLAVGISYQQWSAEEYLSRSKKTRSFIFEKWKSDRNPERRHCQGTNRAHTSIYIIRGCSVTENSRSLATRMVFNTVFLRPLTYPRFPRESLNRPTLLKITFQATAAL